MGPGQEISGSVPCPIFSAGFRPGGRGKGACAPGLEYFAAPAARYFPDGKGPKGSPGDAADGLRLRSAPPRSIGPPPYPLRTPFTGGTLLIPGGAVPARGNLSGQSQLPPGHWALMRWTVEEGGVPLPRLLRCRQRSRVVEVTTPSTTAQLVPHRTQRRALKRRNHCTEKSTCAAAAVGEVTSIPPPPAPLRKPQEEPNWQPP